MDVNALDAYGLDPADGFAVEGWPPEWKRSCAPKGGADAAGRPSERPVALPDR